uniref:Uncharacterized protein n=1 Tax=Kwoniella dejecticola CBS 10117 TaxID=1296121 RepID=A0A1A6A968_9TREE|nr:uncharacterized protein I303_02609 [Kwoniella dejecticola CBS 10117]OBR86600.1 hypothetical protein I303_02609 [Kwoniella dejecticola CBS 10117]
MSSSGPAVPFPDSSVRQNDYVPSAAKLWEWRRNLCRPSALGMEGYRRLTRLEKIICEKAFESDFASVDSIQKYLCRQKGNDPVRMSQWWSGKWMTRTRTPLRNRWSLGLFITSRLLLKDVDMNRRSKTEQLLRQRENFIMAFGDRGERTMQIVEQKAMRDPYRKAFSTSQDLKDDPEVFKAYARYSRMSEAACSEGLAYMLEFARRERDLRKGSKIRLSTLPHGTARETAQHVAGAPVQSAQQASILSNVQPDQLGTSGETLVQNLTAAVSLNPFSMRFHDQPSVMDYLKSPAPQLQRLTREMPDAIATGISQYVARLAADQRNVQNTSTFIAAIGSEAGAHADHGGYLDINTDHSVSNRGYSLPRENEPPGRRVNIDSPTTGQQRVLGSPIAASTSRSVDMSSFRQSEKVDLKMEHFAKTYTSNANIGRTGMEFLMKLGRRVEDEEFNESDYTEREAVKTMLAQNEWSYFEKTIKQKRPDLAEQVIDYVHWLTQKRSRESHRAAAYKAYADSLPQLSDRDSKRELVRWNRFQLKFRHKQDGFGEKGRRQIERLTNFIAKSGSSDAGTKSNWLSYTTQDGIRSILAEDRHSCFTEGDPRADELLDFGVWYTNELISGKNPRDLTLDSHVVEYLEREYGSANSLDPSRHRGDVTSGSDADEMDQPDSDEDESFDEAEMRNHRLMLFGFSAIPSTLR